MEVIGISRSLIEVLVEKAKSAMKEEAEQWQTLEREIVFIKDEFEMMKFPQHRRWGAHEEPDSIEFVLHLDTKRSLWPRLHQSIQSSFLFQPPWKARVLALDRAVADMKLLKARAEDMNQRNLRYNLIDKSKEEMMHNSTSSQSITDIFIKPRDAFDKHSGLLDLTRLITTEDKGLQVVSVCGTGGNLGIVSIMKKVYDDPNIQRKFHCRTWVKMMHPFTPHEFIWSLMAGFCTNFFPQEQGADIGVNILPSMKTTQDSTLTDFMERFKKKTYLIILEDLSSAVEWNVIRTYLPDLKNRSRIIISTQQLKIASLCTGQPYHVSLLRKFSEDHSVYAFFTDQVRRAITKLKLQGTAPRPLSEEDSCPLIAHDSEAKKLADQIKLALSGEAHHRVISVCGIAGVGKSFLVKTLFNDRASPAWKFTNAWSKEDWDLMKANLISKASKSCIIVITREESVARHCATSDDAVCILKGLEAKTALRLFEVIKGAGTSNPDHNMMDEAGFIINKRGRLPKLIVALGNYFDKAPNIIQEMRLNANFMYELKTSKGLDSFRDVFITMHSSFQACPQVLKKCIFYLTLFTQSSIIRRSRLMRRWIAEGYCEGLDSNSKVEFMEKLLGNLGALGMIDKPAQTSAVAGHMSGASFQVTSLFLNYIISQEAKENIFLPLEITVLQGESSLNIHRAGQHLAIGSSWKRDKFVLDSLDFSRLRSMTVSREWRPFFISHRMRVLRVLDLEDTNVKNDDVEQIVAHLLCLKFLSIRRCAKVSCLPDSLGGLIQLQTLDIRHTYVAKLPVSMSKLRMLQYVRAGTSVALMDEEPSTTKRGRYGHVAACDGVKVPSRTAALISLHTLGVINVSAAGDRDIQQLFKNLTQLRKLGVSGINRRNIKGFFSALRGTSTWSHCHCSSTWTRIWNSCIKLPLQGIYSALR
ncbi:hypothetical protein C2845_PMPSC049108 [Panicum miliaceum]|uniref:NB-ARC domain-containing protein n=1 Tax=Panicum miliaceum TaxID=4540 RepID=A0A3L6P9K7_PANMI|nr:hypothetical protein C2845_PMPSC049108 [Panicum miliaceum]